MLGALGIYTGGLHWTSASNFGNRSTLTKEGMPTMGWDGLEGEVEISEKAFFVPFFWGLIVSQDG